MIIMLVAFIVLIVVMGSTGFNPTFMGIAGLVIGFILGIQDKSRKK